MRKPHPMDFAYEHRFWRCTHCGAMRQLAHWGWPPTYERLHKPLVLTCWNEDGTDHKHMWVGASNPLL